VVDVQIERKMRTYVLYIEHPNMHENGRWLGFYIFQTTDRIESSQGHLNLSTPSKPFQIRDILLIAKNPAQVRKHVSIPRISGNSWGIWELYPVSFGSAGLISGLMVWPGLYSRILQQILSLGDILLAECRLQPRPRPSGDEEQKTSEVALYIHEETIHTSSYRPLHILFCLTTFQF